jgi:peptide/nickel transport system permease protein
MSIPSLIFALLLLSIFGTNMVVLIIIIAVIYAPRVFRLTRAVAGDVVVMDYIEAARLRGEKMWYLIRKEILPNAKAPLIAEFGLEFCFVFLLIAGLSFLGLGIQPPTADWGSMVRENATLISYGETTPLIPAAAIALLTVAVNFVVDWMLYRSSGLKE